MTRLRESLLSLTAQSRHRLHANPTSVALACETQTLTVHEVPDGQQ